MFKQQEEGQSGWGTVGDGKRVGQEVKKVGRGRSIQSFVFQSQEFGSYSKEADKPLEGLE